MKLKKISVLLLFVVFLLSACSSTASTASQSAVSRVQADTVSAEPSDGVEVSIEPIQPSEEPSVQPSEETEPPAEVSSEPSEPVEEDPYFTRDGAEEVKEDAKGGKWLYRSSTLYVSVERIFKKKEIQTYFVADIRFKEPEKERAGLAKPRRPLYEMALKAGAVIAVNGDYKNNVEADRKGIIIRNGKVLSEKKAADTLAFYPDGTMRIFKPGEITAKQLLTDGVENTFSFGPTLVKDGEIQANLKKHRTNNRRNPRTAIGMVEPYHYIFIVVDGRSSSRYSKGMWLEELAKVFKDLGCTVAYNLDGGQSATMTFMGKNINKYMGSMTGQRDVPDAIMFGKSDKVTGD